MENIDFTFLMLSDTMICITLKKGKVGPVRLTPVGELPESSRTKPRHFISVVGWPVPFYTD